MSVVVVQNVPWPRWRDRVLRCEELGYDAVYVWDHLVHRTQELHDPLLDGFSLLCGVAPLTSRVGLGTLVASPTLRHPLALAKSAVAVDQLSAGRCRLGIGAAGVLRDYQALGLQPWSKAEQVERFRETVELVAVALAGGSGYDGQHYSGSEFSVAPGPVQPRIPLVLAAHGPRTLRITAEYADVWNSITPRDLPRDEALGVFDQRSALLDRFASDAAREPGAIERSVFVGSPQWPALAGTAEFREVALAYADRGVTEVVLPHPDHPAEHRLGHGPTDPHLVERLAEEGVLAELAPL